MSDLKPRAVLMGSLVDIAGTFVVSGLFFAAVGTASGAASADELVRIIDASAQLQLASIALGLAMTAGGAYVAARLAPAHERLHAFAVGVISTLLGFSFVFASPEASPFWAQATSLILTIPAAFVGGELRRAAARGRRTS